MTKTRGYFLNDLAAMLGRSLRHVFRSLDTIITVSIMPIAMMLLFVYVFGGAFTPEQTAISSIFCPAFY